MDTEYAKNGQNSAGTRILSELHDFEYSTAKMTENEIAKVVVDAAVKVHRELGPGLLET